MLYGIAEVESGYCVEFWEEYDDAERSLQSYSDKYEIIELNESEIDDGNLWRDEEENTED